MIVAMVAVRMVQPPIDEIIDMVAMRNRLVPAIRSVNVAGATDLRRAMYRIRIAHFDGMLVHMIAVHMMQVTIVKIINMAVVTNCGMSASGPVLMLMIGVMFFGACRHRVSSFRIRD
jgi:hypothetical protein